MRLARIGMVITTLTGGTTGLAATMHENASSFIDMNTPLLIGC